MRGVLKWTGIGCGGLVALILVLGIVGAIIGGGNQSGVSPSPSSSPPPTSSEGGSSPPPPPSTPEPIQLTGNGQMATDPVRLESGLAIFRMNYQGGQNFIVHLLDANGNPASNPLGGTLANKIGAFQGSQAAQTKAQQYVLDVQASGPWTITIEQPRPSSAPATTNFSGEATTATDLFQLSKGLKKFEMTHQGGENFIVHLLDKNGAPVSNPLGGTLVNEIGGFNGSKAAQIPKDDIYLLQVEANGPWTIQIQ